MEDGELDKVLTEVAVLRAEWERRGLSQEDLAREFARLMCGGVGVEGDQDQGV